MHSTLIKRIERLEQARHTKQCIVCLEDKPLSEFYKNGTDYYCKSCRLQYNRTHSTHETSPSTQDALNWLQSHGVVEQKGGDVGYPLYDIVAYGYVPIEAKGANPHRMGAKGQEGYCFLFKREQRERLFGDKRGFVILVFHGNEDHILVMPSDHPLVSQGNTVNITINSQRLDRISAWDELKKFENAYHLIHDRVIGDIQGGKQ